MNIKLLMALVSDVVSLNLMAFTCTICSVKNVLNLDSVQSRVTKGDELIAVLQMIVGNAMH
jgi:hypothetical protein